MPGSRRSPTGRIDRVPGARTIWILGDQLNTGAASLRDADPARERILMIRSEGKKWEVALGAEAAYRQMMSDWRRTGGAGATTGERL